MGNDFKKAHTHTHTPKANVEWDLEKIEELVFWFGLPYNKRFIKNSGINRTTFLILVFRS